VGVIATDVFHPPDIVRLPRAAAPPDRMTSGCPQESPCDKALFDCGKTACRALMKKFARG